MEVLWASLGFICVCHEDKCTEAFRKAGYLMPCILQSPTCSYENITSEINENV